MELRRGLNRDYATRLKLKKLQSLSIKLHDYHYEDVRRLLVVFDYENLQSLTINIGDEVLPDLGTLFNKVWRTNQFKKLTDLSFTIRPTYHDVYESSARSPRFKILYHFLEDCEGVQNIYLECPEGDNNFFGFSNRLAALRLKNCHLFGNNGTPEEYGPDIIYEMEHVFKQRGEMMDGCLLLDGLKTSPLEKAEIVRTAVSDRVSAFKLLPSKYIIELFVYEKDMHYIRGEFAM